VPRRHEDSVDPEDHRDAWVVFLDIAPDNDELLALSRCVSQLTVLDHHVTARDRYRAEPDVMEEVEGLGHEIVYEMGHSGSILAWDYFAGLRGERTPAPDLLRYVEDQDLWSWQLADSQAVNAAIAAYPRRFDVWDELAERPIADLAQEGRSIVRANRVEALRIVQSAHPLQVEGRLVEAVNATSGRSAIGHELSERKAYGVPWSCVYRITGDRVHATLYSIGDVDVGSIAARLGGGGHRNAAGFSVSLADWLRDFLAPGR
jgi:oligoribonuclease NrnB/cAMP/cGMP phosphodiesterase (DHH superfamily)